MSKRILVVEDQPNNRQIIRDMLAPTDYEIAEVESGEEALTAIAKQRPDLILMDIRLPIMDGYTATSQIKADPALRSIPIIAVTSYALSGEEKKARAAGCDDYVPKPFSPRQLLAKIRNYLQAAGMIAALHLVSFWPLASVNAAQRYVRSCVNIGSGWSGLETARLTQRE
jgi:two-component system, cell cycle response regulator DivK